MVGGRLLGVQQGQDQFELASIELASITTSIRQLLADAHSRERCLSQDWLHRMLLRGHTTDVELSKTSCKEQKH